MTTLERLLPRTSLAPFIVPIGFARLCLFDVNHALAYRAAGSIGWQSVATVSLLTDAAVLLTTLWLIRVWRRGS